MDRMLSPSWQSFNWDDSGDLFVEKCDSEITIETLAAVYTVTLLRSFVLWGVARDNLHLFWFEARVSAPILEYSHWIQCSRNRSLEEAAERTADSVLTIRVEKLVNLTTFESILLHRITNRELAALSLGFQFSPQLSHYVRYSRYRWLCYCRVMFAD